MDYFLTSKLPGLFLAVLLYGCAGAGGSSAPDGGDTDPEIDTELPNPDDYIAVDIECNSEIMCVLTAAGGVKCWGSKLFAMGNGLMSTSEPTPRYVVGLNRGVKSISYPSGTAFAIKDDGTVWGWGGNDYGQLGANFFDGESLEPVQIVGLEDDDVVQISNGGAHVCAVLADGSAKCWGSNYLGWLGNGADVSDCEWFYDCIEQSPVNMVGLENPLEIMFAGWYAIDSEGTLLFWGDLGYWGGENGEQSSIAVPFQGLSQGEVAKIAGLGGTICALTVEETVKCWTTGGNTLGALGNGTIEETHEVVDVVGLDESVIDLGYCAVLESGKVKCWGDNRRAALGNGTWDTDYIAHPFPEEVIGLDGRAVAICNRCVLMEDGGIECWGEVPGVMLEEGYEECNEWYCFYKTPGTVPGFGPAAPPIGTPEDYNHKTELVGTWNRSSEIYPRQLVITEGEIVMTGDGPYIEPWSVTWKIINASNTLDRLKLKVVEVSEIGYEVGEVKYHSYRLEGNQLILYRADDYEYPIPLGGSESDNFITYTKQ